MYLKVTNKRNGLSKNINREKFSSLELLEIIYFYNKTKFYKVEIINYEHIWKNRLYFK